MTVVATVSSARDFTQLKNKLEQIASRSGAETGIAIIIDGKDTVTVNNDMRYPMMSVFKFHQAVAVCHKVEKQNISLDSTMFISKEELPEGTYSPLRDKYPDGNLNLSIRTLLEYTLLLSDNNACDILFNRIAGVKETDAFIRSLGVNDFSIVADETGMRKDMSLCYANWSSPLAIAELIDMLFTKNILKSEYRDFIIGTMIKCNTGANRIPSFDHKGNVTVGHKTGTGGRNSEGNIIAVNDAGFVLLPDGRRFTITVYVKDCTTTVEKAEKIIADVTQCVYDFVS